MSDRVLAVVVTYNAELDTLTALLETTLEQVAGVCVVDNASSNIQAIQHRTEQDPSIHLIALPHNEGLGAAHNQGIAWAQANDYSHVLLLDQDSVPESNMVANLLVVWRARSVNEKVSAVGARYLNQDNQSSSFFIRFGLLKFQRFYCQNADSVEADFLISSGSLISLDSLQQIGNMDEGLFIDHVDTEWFLRAKSLGFKAYGACNALMQHGLGEMTHQIKLIRQRNVPQHKPFRYYYIFRNSILLYKRGYCSLRWKWNDLQRLMMIAVMYGLFCAPRWAHIKMMSKGIVDGLLGRTGALKLTDNIKG